VYDSFGNLTSSTGPFVQPFRYTGREWDAETGLYYYRARYYDPVIGRFLSEDPIGFAGSVNFYRYVDNGPINSIDPGGLVGRASPAECKRLLKQIVGIGWALAKEIAKYDPISDGQGGPIWDPGGHHREMGMYVVGIINRTAQYYKDCGGKGLGKVPEWCWQKVKDFKKVPLPVFPITSLELQLNEESARAMERFWETIIWGDAALAIVGTGGAAGVFGGAGVGVGAGSGAGGLIPILAH